MASFKIDWKSSAEKDIRSLEKSIIPKIIQAIEKLANDPQPTGSKKLSGSDKSYRIRIGDYRVIYQIDIDASSVTIFHVRHRKDVYKQ